MTSNNRPNGCNPTTVYCFTFKLILTDGSEQLVELQRTFDEAEKIGLAGNPWPVEFPELETVETVEMI